MSNTPMQVFQSFGEGLMSGTDSWKEVVSESIVFQGPVDRVEGLDEFEKLNAKFMPMIRGNKMNLAVESGDYVVTQVEFEIATPSGPNITLDMTEWYEVSDGKIQSIRVYYDAEEYRREVACAS